MKFSTTIAIILSLLTAIKGQHDHDHNDTDPCSEPLDHHHHFIVSEDEFNLEMRIIGIFVIFGISCVSVGGSIFAGSNEKLKNNKVIFIVLQILKYFGIGVIASTAWIHVLPEAFAVLSSECVLSRGLWSVYGASFVGIFGLSISFAIQGIEFAVISRNQNINKNHTSEEKDRQQKDEKIPLVEHNGKPATLERHEDKGDIYSVVGHDHGMESELVGNATKDIGTIVLQLGILVHSIVIGIALGVTIHEWESLFIAICFHQFFEGIALGVRISALTSIVKLWKKLGLGFLYPVTTPIGVAIGISVHMFYSEDNYTTLVAQGVLGSLAAGILIYSTYVELLGLEMNQNKVLLESKFSMKVVCFMSMYVGAVGMAIIGLWG